MGAGGNNSVVPEKKIKKAALEQYLAGGYNVNAIVTQVTNGKNSMPAFGERLARTTSRTWRATCTTRPTSGKRRAVASPRAWCKIETRPCGPAHTLEFFQK